jgi:sugar phosphate isomerase/epimerase
MLDDAGLQCCGTHTGLNTLQGGQLKATVEFNKILGNKYLICPGMDGKTVQGWKDLANLFTGIAEKLKADGMFTVYHAHGGDFKKLEDTTPWDVFFSNAGPDVVMQMDTGNCAGAGADPVALLKKYPGRTQTIHLKEHGGGVIGEGKLPWKEIFELCQGPCKTEWYIVEEEGGGQKALEVLKRAVDNLKKLLA